MRVLITGGAKRLGREMALAFAEKGDSIAIHYNTSSVEARALAGEIEKKGCRAVAVQADVRNLEEVQGAVQRAVEALGGLDILINNAAMFYKTPLVEVTEAAWNELIDVNLRAPFFFVKVAAPFLKAAGVGRIINIADTYGLSPSAGYVPYGVSKASLIAMTKGFAKELAPEVLVNCVCPGVIKTRDEGRWTKDEKAINATLLKKPVTVDDVIKTVLFLAGNNSMTGQAVFVDGGKNV